MARPEFDKNRSCGSLCVECSQKCKCSALWGSRGEVDLTALSSAVKDLHLRRGSKEAELKSC